MKITIFIGGLYGGGAERVACNLASYLVNGGHEVEFLTVGDNEKTYPYDDKITKFCLLKNSERKGYFYNLFVRSVRFLKYILFHKCDVYVVMLPITIVTLLRFSFLVRAKIIAAERSIPTDYSQKQQALLRNLAHRADGWVFQTEEQKNWYGKSIDNCMVRVIPNAISPNFMRPIYEGDREKVIITAGRLTGQKNHLLLIQAFKSISAKYPDYNLHIYGDGALKGALQNKIEELGLSERVSILPYSADIADKMRVASLFVLSSDFEGMPNVLMEAMALGVPSISTDCRGGGARFLIQDGVNGLLVPIQNVDALVEAMDRILADSILADNLGKEAHKLCAALAPEKIYGYWDSAINETIKVY